MNPSTIEKLKSYIQQIPSQFVQLNQSDLQNKPAPNKWSKKEIFGHLIDSARVNLQRFLEAQHTEGTYTVHRYHQDELVKINDYQNLPIGELAQLWKTTNQQILRVFEKINEKELSKAVEIPHEGKSESLRYIMEDYVAHIDHHAKQIFGELFLPIRQTGPIKPVHHSGGKEKRSVSVSEAMQQLKAEQLFTKVLEYGSMYVEIYQPKVQDNQTPHDQDELYVVISGNGDFYNNGITKSFQSGDVLFVPAGIEHRFLNFSNDFKTWVIFYGPKGGEQNI